MESYEIEWKRSAKKELKRLPRNIIKNIISSVEALISNPHPIGSKKIIGAEHTYRQRVGDYRIVYSLEHNHLIIEIIRVGHRKDVYRKFN